MDTVLHHKPRKNLIPKESLNVFMSSFEIISLCSNSINIGDPYIAYGDLPRLFPSWVTNFLALPSNSLLHLII